MKNKDATPEFCLNFHLGKSNLTEAQKFHIYEAMKMFGRYVAAEQRQICARSASIDQTPAKGLFIDRSTIKKAKTPIWIN